MYRRDFAERAKGQLHSSGAMGKAQRAKFQCLLKEADKCVCVCVPPVSSGSGETGSVIRDHMSVRRRAAATLPSEKLPVQMMGQRSKVKRGGGTQADGAGFCAYLGTVYSKKSMKSYLIISEAST